jgi:hypothetical protein
MRQAKGVYNPRNRLTDEPAEWYYRTGIFSSKIKQGGTASDTD